MVRTDLPLPQQAVQSCHACIEATKAFAIDELEDHPSVIILGVKSEEKLQQVRKYLIDHGIKHVHFYESDLEDELTALATEPIHGDRRKLFRKFQLIKAKGQHPPDAEQIQYALKYPDGYYKWMGECSRSPDRTWRLEDASFYSCEQSARAWVGDHGKDGVVVSVRTRYYEGGAK